MAKKINTDEDTNTSADLSATEQAGTQTEKIKKSENKENTFQKEEPALPEGNSFVEGLLKTYPSYESLYIDAHGGVFTVGTSLSVRGKAILYKNPFYKS